MRLLLVGPLRGARQHVRGRVRDDARHRCHRLPRIRCWPVSSTWIC